MKRLLKSVLLTIVILIVTAFCGHIGIWYIQDYNRVVWLGIAILIGLLFTCIYVFVERD